MHKRAGTFIVIDGIAGSGKSTLIRAIDASLRAQGKKIFDLGAWTKEHKEPPRFEDVSNYDVYFTFEPTKYWVGEAIRYGLSFGKFEGIEHAHAFALDRHIQYERLILPALNAGKIIIQDRSVSSSIVYQPIMEDGPSLRALLKLPGNSIAMENAPDHLILTHINPDNLSERFKRDDDSKGIFENIDYLKKVDKRFRSRWFSKLFTKQGTCVHQFSTEQPKEEMEKSIQKLISTILQ